MTKTSSTLAIGGSLLFAQACAAMPDSTPGRQLGLLVASPDSRIGGEAYVEGTLQADNGCVVIDSGGRTAVPIFDSSVRLADTRNALIDESTGRSFRFGTRVSAAAAWLRDNGRGWSFADIEALVGPSVPAQCSGETIVRLKGLEGIPGTQSLRRHSGDTIGHNT